MISGRKKSTPRLLHPIRIRETNRDSNHRTRRRREVEEKAANGEKHDIGESLSLWSSPYLRDPKEHSRRRGHRGYGRGVENHTMKNKKKRARTSQKTDRILRALSSRKYARKPYVKGFSIPQGKYQLPLHYTAILINLPPPVVRKLLKIIGAITKQSGPWKGGGRLQRRSSSSLRGWRKKHFRPPFYSSSRSFPVVHDPPTQEPLSERKKPGTGGSSSTGMGDNANS